MSNRTAAIARKAQDGRTPKGTWAPGVSGNPTGAAANARRLLNLDTIKEMHRAFNEGGRKAIDECMKKHPAVFLKLLVLLVPRELEVTHSSGVKGLSDEQLESAIAAIQEMLAKRADAAQARPGDDAKLIEAVPEKPTKPARIPGPPVGAIVGTAEPSKK